MDLSRRGRHGRVGAAVLVLRRGWRGLAPRAALPAALRRGQRAPSPLTTADTVEKRILMSKPIEACVT